MDHYCTVRDSRMNGLKTGLGITPGEHIISADSALSRNIRQCFCLSCRGRLILQTDAQGAWFEHDLYALSEATEGGLRGAESGEVPPLH